jgi:hypothetical protein
MLANLRNRHEMAPLFRIREASLLVHHFDLICRLLAQVCHGVGASLLEHAFDRISGARDIAGAFQVLEGRGNDSREKNYDTDYYD